MPPLLLCLSEALFSLAGERLNLVANYFLFNLLPNFDRRKDISRQGKGIFKKPETSCDLEETSKKLQSLWG